MTTLRAITLRLEPDDYGRLEAEAAHLGIPPATLARMYVRSRLNGGETAPERQRRDALAAIDRLRELTTDLPSTDAVRVARESRQELEDRPKL